MQKFHVAAAAAVVAAAGLVSCLGLTVPACAQTPPSPQISTGNGQFSAFAVNNQGRMGAALFFETPRAAQSGALANCGGKSAGCKVYYTTPASRCAAFAEGRQRSRFRYGVSYFRYGGSYGSSQQQVSEEALRSCQRRSLADSCSVAVAQCR